jgi:hypothetical protein
VAHPVVADLTPRSVWILPRCSRAACCFPGNSACFASKPRVRRGINYPLRPCLAGVNFFRNFLGRYIRHFASVQAKNVGAVSVLPM